MDPAARRRRRLVVLGLLLVALGAALLRITPQTGGFKSPDLISFQGDEVGQGVFWSARPGSGGAVGGVTGWRGLLLGVPLDPATAGERDWDALPGVGKKGAKELVATRGIIGGYRVPEDLLRVRGIGEKRLLAIRPWLAFGGSAGL